MIAVTLAIGAAASTAAQDAAKYGADEKESVRERPVSTISVPYLGASIAIDPQSTEWTVEDVALWAYKHSPTAAVLEVERAALARQLDCDDEEQRAMIGLAQAVLAELALHARTEAAADAKLSYYRLVAARRQLEVLNGSAPLVEQLESLAETAERLEIVDGDRDKLADERLVLEDKWFEIDFSVQRLFGQLGGLLGNQVGDGAHIQLLSPLPQGDAIGLDETLLIEHAFSHRHDLKAIEALCRCLNCKSLPAARKLLGSFVPGIGLDLLTAASGGGILKLHGHRQDDSADLAQRKAQCHKLAESRREQIAAEVHDALLRVQAAIARGEVARRRVAAQRIVADRARRGEELEQVLPGTQLQAELKLAELETLQLLQELALAEGVVALERAIGDTL